MATETTRGELIAKVIKIRRCAAVVKGGRRFSVTALVVVGDGRGTVGWGYGKANEVPPAVEKAIKDGARNLQDIPMSGTTIPHTIQGHFGAARVVLDSRIAGFDQLVRRAAEVAAARGVTLSEATVSNLEALGVRLAELGAER